MKKREFKISFFLHVWEKKAKEISLEEFHNDLRGARWKVLAESYRRWMRTGMTEEGKRLKGALNAVVVAGKCRGGHAANQVTELNGLALFDFDHCLEMLAGMKEKAGALPYVVGDKHTAERSCSGYWCYQRDPVFFCHNRYGHWFR